MTYRNLYLDVRRQFRSAGLPGAELEARELLCFGAGISRAAFYRDGNLEAPPEIEKIVRKLAQRHLDGEPAAYLIGEWEFFGLTLDVSPAVLIPRIDTEVLAEAAIAYLQTAGACRVLDLCAGSGCIGLAVAVHVPECRVLLGELSGDALQVCRNNVRRCGMEDRVDVMRLDALEPPPEEIGKFQCIVCNPPYIPADVVKTLDRSVRDFEPLGALCGGKDGLDFYRAVSRKWKTVLTENGKLFFETGIGQADAAALLMRDAGFGDINTIPDTQGILRVVYGTAMNEALV